MNAQISTRRRSPFTDPRRKPTSCPAAAINPVPPVPSAGRIRRNFTAPFTNGFVATLQVLDYLKPPFAFLARPALARTTSHEHRNLLESLQGIRFNTYRLRGSMDSTTPTLLPYEPRKAPLASASRRPTA